MSSIRALAYVDRCVRPQDDLFRHVNGAWLRTATIPADRSGAGAFLELRDQAERDVRAIIEQQPVGEGDAGRIAGLWASFMDSERIERLGALPLAPILSRIDELDSPAALARHLGWALRHGIGSLLRLTAEVDPGNPERYALLTAQGGLGLPDESYYRLDEHAGLRKQYVAHVTRVLTLAGAHDPASQAATVLELETLIAAQHWDRVRCRNLRAMYNPTSLATLKDEAPGWCWSDFLAGAGIGEDAAAELVVAQPSFVVAASRLLAQVPLPQWRCWARWRSVACLSPYLSRDFTDERFDFYERVLAGTEAQRPRWQRAIAFVQGAVGEAIGTRYVAQHFRPEAKAMMEDLVANLLRAYRESIETLPWMTEATRHQALDKLSKFTAKIGYPGSWRDYSRLRVSDSDLVGNALAVASAELDYALEKLNGPVNPDEWRMFPQTVNAYYYALRNEIVFPAAILQAPFFAEDADSAMNYGAIGAIIGHEIGHAFDDKGSACDGDGRLRDWWRPADREAFEALTSRLVERYDALSPEGVEETVNGRLTLGENIGDLGGLTVAYRAWILSGGDPNGPPIDGLSPAQRFFFGWAQAWRSTLRPEAMRLRLVTDPHSPAEFRCNEIVRHLDAFHDAFDVSPGDGLWLSPEERITIW